MLFKKVANIYYYSNIKIYYNIFEVVKLSSRKFTEKEIYDVFEKLQIPIEEKSYGKFEVWEIPPMKKSSQSFTKSY